MFQPIARIAQQGGKALADFMVGNTNILLGGSIESTFRGDPARFSLLSTRCEPDRRIDIDFGD